MTTKDKQNKTGTFIIELKKPYLVLECDHSFLDMISLSLNDINTKYPKLNNLIHKDDYNDLISSLEYQLQRSNFTSDRARFINGDSKYQNILINGQAFSLDDGREILQCTCTDITSLETAALMTESSFTDLEAFAQSMRCGLSKHVCDNSLTLIWANDYYYKIFGYSKAEYIDNFGESLIPMVYPDDLSLVINSITSLMVDHEIDINFRIKHKTKPFRWVNLIASSSTQNADDDFPIGNFVLNDITSLKFAEMKAELEAKKYEIIANISEEIPFDYEIATDTITYAKKYEELFGRRSIYRHPAQKFIAANYISEDTQDHFISIFESAQAGTENFSTEYKLLNKEGVYEWYHSSFALIKDTAGNPLQAIGVIRNINAQKLEQASLLKRAQTDSMTGLLNKATTQAHIEASLKNIPADTYGIAMVIDIDDFKTINDTFGHLTGDKVIIDIAQTLTKYTANHGIVGRIGGDEFLVYLSNVLDTQLACEIAKNYATDLRSKYPVLADKPKVSLSIGIAATNHPMSYTELMEQADSAVYQTKQKGKNGYTLYQE